MTYSNLALITGASGGIGAEFARIHAEKGGDMVLVARSEDKLNQLKTELESKHGVNVIVLAEDLGKPGAAGRVFEFTESQNMQVEVLINNAGFGGHGKFVEREIEADKAMIQLNVTALTELTHAYLKGMVERRSGKVLNVSSTASFIPGPLQAVYYATKAFVTSFSQAIAEEVSEHNVSVTALCPGAVDTGFVKAGDLDNVDVWKNAKSARSVAEVGYRDMMGKELLSFNEGLLKFAINWVFPLLPRKQVLKASRKSMEKSH